MLVKGFVDDLVFGQATKGHPLYGKGIYRPLTATIELHRPIALPRAITNTNKLLSGSDPSVLKSAAILCLAVSEIGEGINHAGQVVVKTWLSKAQGVELAHATRLAYKLPWLKATADSVLHKFNADLIAESMKTAALPPELVSRAAQIYGSAKNFDEANHAAAVCAIPNAPHLTEHDLDLIFGNAAAGLADLQGSFTFPTFIRALYDNNPLGQAGINTLLAKHDLQHYGSK